MTVSGLVSLSTFISNIIHVRIHKGFIVFGGRGERWCSYITVEQEASQSRGERAYRARLIEQHLVRVNEKLCRLCLQRAARLPDKVVIATNEENARRSDYVNAITRIMHF